MEKDYDKSILIGEYAWYVDDDGAPHLVKIESYDESDDTFVVELRNRSRVRVTDDQLEIDDPSDIPLF